MSELIVWPMDRFGRFSRAAWQVAAPGVAAGVSAIAWFFLLKLYLLVWFATHGSDPFVQVSPPMATLYFATDLVVGVLVAGAVGGLGILSLAGRFGRGLAWIATLVILAALLALGVVNLKIEQQYSMAATVGLLRKGTDLDLMAGSYIASMSADFWVAIAVGAVLLFAGTPRLARALAAKPQWIPCALAVAVAGSSAVAATRSFRQRETLGLKHNPVLSLYWTYQPPKTMRDLRAARQALSARYPDPSLVPVYASVTQSAPEPGAAELAGLAKGMNVVLVLLESIPTRYLDEQTAPNLARLRRQSVAWTRHYTTAANTFDSQYSIFRSHLIRGEDFEARRLHRRGPPDASIFDAFADSGWDVGLFHGSALSFIDTRWVWDAPGAQIIEDATTLEQRGVRNWSAGVPDRDLSQAAIAWISQRREKPFFLLLNQVGTHHPYHSVPPRPFTDKTFDAAFRNAVHTSDRAVGDLLDALERNGQMERTVLVVASDHGETVDDLRKERGHGIHFSDDELRVPFFVVAPGAVPRELSTVTDHLDVAPTLAALASLPASPGWFGRNLLGESVAPRRAVVGLSHRLWLGFIDGELAASLDVVQNSLRWFRVGGEQFESISEDAVPVAMRESARQQLYAFIDLVLLRHLHLAGDDPTAQAGASTP